MQGASKTVVAIPVKNEEARIGLCLAALGQQSDDFDHVLLLLNNCTDATLTICQDYARRLEKLQIVQCSLLNGFGSAGEARRLALSQAADLAGNGVILTTDADAIPGENWVRDNLAALRRGADVVCGIAELEARDAQNLPRAMQVDGGNEAQLMSIQDQLATMIDPDPDDPWPRHQQHSGASIALSANILRIAGGPPDVPMGEDRALIEKLQLVDARIRHEWITVHVSGRLEGRAEGGMAATIKRRMRQRDRLTDERLEPTVDAYRRALAKARLRAARLGLEDADRLAEDLLIGAGVMRQALKASHFGAAWAEIQRVSLVLQRRRVETAGLRREIRQAISLRDQLQGEMTAPRTALPGDEGNLSSGENAR